MRLREHLKEHFLETKSLLRKIPPTEVAYWFLKEGYFPERYVLPPSFKVSDFKLLDEPYNKDLSDLTRRHIAKISYPKTLLTSREFGIIHPWNYHDIVFNFYEHWDLLIDHLFHDEQKIYSYSNPIPVTKKNKGRVGRIRAGRMIYEWLSMAENDMVLDAGKYQFIARTDISNFYSSIYTHTIPWSLHGREGSLSDKCFSLLGNKVDRLLQYSNDGRTNGIPVGPALTDFIAEIVLSGVDVNVSRRIGNKVDFQAARFKDDYRILCASEKDGQKILQEIADVLQEYNLVINEKKTSILKLPDEVYRKHDREYFPYSIRDKKEISFKLFEHTLLVVLEIHRRHPGTSILEKFISELFDNNKQLKVYFSGSSNKKLQEIKKMVELLFFAKRESQKILCHVLAVCEQLYITYKKQYKILKEYFQQRIRYEMKIASEKRSTFEVVWYIFFSRFIGLGLTGNDIKKIVDDHEVKRNLFYKSILNSKQEFFKDSEVSLFVKPRDCKEKSLAKQINVFS